MHRTSQTLPAPMSPHRITSGFATNMLFSSRFCPSSGQIKGILLRGGARWIEKRGRLVKQRQKDKAAPLCCIIVLWRLLLCPFKLSSLGRQVTEKYFSEDIGTELSACGAQQRTRGETKHLASCDTGARNKSTRCRLPSTRLFRPRRAFHAMRGTPTNPVSCEQAWCCYTLCAPLLPHCSLWQNADARIPPRFS